MSGGINGNYADSCIICLKGTDTALALIGEAEWCIGGLVALGIPIEQAYPTFADGLGCTDGMVPDGEITLCIRVCKSCVDKSGTGMKVALVHGDVPGYCSAARMS